MIKVIMLSAEGRETDLFPEHDTFREVLDHFHVDYAVMVNGKLLQQKDLDKQLLLFSKDAEIRITLSRRTDETEEIIPVIHPYYPDDRKEKTILGLMKAKEIIERAMEVLGMPSDDIEPPF